MTSGSSILFNFIVMDKYFFLSHRFMWSNVENNVCDANHFKSCPAVDNRDLPTSTWDMTSNVVACVVFDNVITSLPCDLLIGVELIFKTASNSFKISSLSSSLPSQTAQTEVWKSLKQDAQPLPRSQTKLLFYSDSYIRAFNIIMEHISYIEYR